MSQQPWKDIDFAAYPDARGHFGQFGGQFVSETLMAAVSELERSYRQLSQDAAFHAEFDHDMAHYVGRPSPLYFAERMTRELGGAQIFLKREDLNHTGAHKVNNTIGQALLAKAMGKTRIIAETGAGQHGVATATVAARLGLECHVYMGVDDIARQTANVYRMKILGANVVGVDRCGKRHAAFERPARPLTQMRFPSFAAGRRRIRPLERQHVADDRQIDGVSWHTRQVHRQQDALGVLFDIDSRARRAPQADHVGGPLSL